MPDPDLPQLSQLARTLAWIEDSDEFMELTPAGEGNMNWVRRATLASGGSMILKQSLPYVAKYPGIPAPIERIEVERAFYAAIAETALAEQTPTVIGFDATSHTLCLEDLGSASDLTTLYAPSATDTNQTIAVLLSWLSDLHAVDVADPNDFLNKAMRQLNHEHIFALPFQKENGLEFSSALTEVWEVLLTRDLRDQAMQLGQRYLCEETKNGCLLHGDFYPGSWLSTPSGSFAVIDPEFAFYGPAEFDVGVLWAHLLFAGFSHPQVASLLDNYQGPPGFSNTLAGQFAGVEILRRLFGVAQLPLSMDDGEKISLASTAKELALA
ncbi:MAG: phosphotransferase [Pseudomonadales bacterium]|nr:phosphotransferase [Pseudomonadales bacterium]